MQWTVGSEGEELLRKYREILRLRRAPADEDPKEAMAALAREFPGSLREADDLPMRELERRVEALEVIQRGTPPPETWMLAVSRYHRLTRGALAIKRWLRGRKLLDAGIEAELLAALSTLPFPEDTKLWRDDLAAVARPPGGRLTRLVVERLGREMEMTVSEVRTLLFSLPLD
jgi:hypothetical protein